MRRITVLHENSAWVEPLGAAFLGEELAKLQYGPRRWDYSGVDENRVVWPWPFKVH